MELIIIILFIVHLTGCVVCLILKLLKILKCEAITIYLAFFLPIFGMVMILFQSAAYDRKEKTELSEELNKLKVEEVNQSIQMDDDDEPKQVVPISEVLRVNTASEKKILLMDVLYTSPSSYTSQLTEAKMDEDTEVVHYAVTALAEIQKDYDVRLQKLARQREEQPEEPGILKSYQHLLEQYIFSGLLSVSIKKEKLHELCGILLQRMEKEQNQWTLCNKLASVYCLLEEPEKLYGVAETIIRISPENENGYLFKIKSEIMRNNKKGILDVIKELEEKEIHLTGEGKDIINFWK